MTIDTNTLIAVVSALVSIPTTVIVFFLSQNYLSNKNRNRLIRTISRHVLIFQTEEDLKNYAESRRVAKKDPQSAPNYKVKTFREYLSEILGLKYLIFVLVFFILYGMANLVAKSTLFTFLYWFLVSFLFWAITIFLFNYLVNKLDKSYRRKAYKHVFKLYHRDFSWFLVVFLLGYLGGTLWTNIHNSSFFQGYGTTIVAPLSFVFLFVYSIPILIQSLNRTMEIGTLDDVAGDLFSFFSMSYVGRIMPAFIDVDVGGKELVRGVVQGVGTDVLRVGNSYVNWESILYFKIE